MINLFVHIFINRFGCEIFLESYIIGYITVTSQWFPLFFQNCKWLKGEGKVCFGGSEKLETAIYTGITQIGKSFNTMKVKIESKADGREVLDLLYV